MKCIQGYGGGLGKYGWRMGRHEFPYNKDVVPDTQQPDLTQQACLFINKKLGTEYSTEGLGDFSKTEEKTIVSITEINFRLYQK